MFMRETDRSHLGLSVAPRKNVRTPKMLKLDPFEEAMREYEPPPRWKTFGLNLLWAIGGPLTAVIVAVMMWLAFFMMIWMVGG